MSKFQENSAGFLANQMARLFASGLARRLNALDLAPAQFMVLLELWDEDARTQVDLVAALDVEQATMANTLSRMERDKLIERRPSETDKRVRIVVLTEKASQLQKAAMEGAQAQNAAALAGFSPDEVQTFLSLMSRTIRNLKSEA
ncbi:MarR family winged helix-turn-helix transcriptional regulator [Falsiruegeria litorea]|uniref:MarR family winged helix-turn-helix transcriptional regulator n=1 Tax=Falsiruegeria litorea TaxID=1280831 RepID=UPI001BFD5F2D|nr:MarR family transcriptional regulator [Falsiruegeria litorea]MBT8167838.1 MarR family transcriptional regulator [Falsiruegeria litorea]